jgi:hypothetical protein
MIYYLWTALSGQRTLNLCVGCSSAHVKQVGDKAKSQFSRRYVSDLGREDIMECQQCGILIKRKASEDPLYDM